MSVGWLVIEGLDVLCRATPHDDNPFGDLSRAWSGRMRSTVVSRPRRFSCETAEISADDALALRLTLQNPGPVKVSGTAVGLESEFHVSRVRVNPIAHTESASAYIVSFDLEETASQPPVLLFSFDADAPGPYTLTRSGAVGSAFGPDGLLQDYAADVLRTDWTLVDGVLVPTTLLEPARTNVYDFSDDLSNAAWTKQRTSVAVGATVMSPKGVTSSASGVYALIEDSAAGQHYLEQTLPSLTDDEPQSTSFWVRASSRSVCYIQTISKANRSDFTYFDLSAGEVGTLDANHLHALIRPGPLAGALRWYRVTVVWDPQTGGTTPRALLGVTSADGTSSYTGDGTSRIFVWNPQFEVDAPCPSSDIVTTSATNVSRGAETMTRTPGFTLADIQVAGAATFYTKWIERGTAHDAGVSTRYWQAGDAVRLIMYAGSAGDGTINGQLFNTGGGSANSSPAATVPIGSPAEARLVLYRDTADSIWKVLCGVSVDGEDEVLGSVATFGAELPEFDEDLFTFASSHNNAAQEPVGLRSIKGFTGSRTLAECRKLASARLHPRAA